MTVLTRRDVKFDHLLSKLSVAYEQKMKAGSPFSWARDLWPRIPVPAKAFSHAVFNKGDQTRVEMAPRGAYEEAAIGGYKLTYEEKKCLRAALKTPQPREIKQEMYVNGLDADKADMRYLTQQSYLYREVQIANKHFAANKWSGFADQTGVDSATPSTNEFENFDRADCDPLKWIGDVVLGVYESCGQWPNRMALGPKTWWALIKNAKIRSALGTNNAATLKAMNELITALFGIERLFVLAAVVNTAKEGQTAVLSNVMGKGLWIGYVDELGGPEVYSAGGVFTYDEFDMLKGEGVGIYRIPNAAKDGVELETEQYALPAIMAADAGAMMLNCTKA